MTGIGSGNPSAHKSGNRGSPRVRENPGSYLNGLAPGSVRAAPGFCVVCEPGSRTEFLSCCRLQPPGVVTAEPYCYEAVLAKVTAPQGVGGAGDVRHSQVSSELGLRSGA
jgi:hypothetical protein